MANSVSPSAAWGPHKALSHYSVLSRGKEDTVLMFRVLLLRSKRVAAF